MKKAIFLLGLFALLGCRVIRDSLYQNTNIYIGAAVSLNNIEKDTAAMHVLLSDFNSITAENDMKMQQIIPEKDQYNWPSADKYVAFTKKNNMRLHGHTLIWHGSVPEWVNNIKDTAEMHRFFRDYITAYVKHVDDGVQSWDVVNEAISDSAGLPRKTIFYNALGSSYIAEAFSLANKANPHALLFYNEYGIENDDVKLKAMLKLVDDLNAAKIPIHGVGIQMHITIDTDLDKYRNALKEFVKRGLLIHISELDIRVNNDTEKDRFKNFNHHAAKLQKEKYYDVVKTYLEVVPRNQQYGITLWGFSDAHSWIIHYCKLNDWPCIYDSRMKRKPAYNGMWKALSE
jgi:endo-1,4-beta-xylanase